MISGVVFCMFGSAVLWLVFLSSMALFRAPSRAQWAPDLDPAVAELDVLTINVPSRRAIEPWIGRIFPKLRTYSLDLEKNTFTVAAARPIEFARKMYPRERAESEWPVTPDWYINGVRTTKQRLQQLQQGMDVARVLRHWHETVCQEAEQAEEGGNAGGSRVSSSVSTKIFAFVEDDFSPCRNEREHLFDMIKWARTHPDKWNSVRWTYGLGGMLMQCRDLPALTGYLDAHMFQPGVDWVTDRFFVLSWNRRCDTPGCKMRRPFIMNKAATFHSGNGKSTIWDGALQTDGYQKAEDTGCINLRTQHEYYEGYAIDDCGERGVISPCDDDSELPQRMLAPAGIFGMSRRGIRGRQKSWFEK